MLTMQQRREYEKEWRKNNRDKLKERRRDNARRKALADLKSTKMQTVDLCIIRTWQGGEYVIGRPRR